ncbi:MAG TPA: calcium/sodium antiporter [Pseudomonadales bacterium]
MLLDLLAVTVGAALLYFGADGLVRGSASLARHWRLTPLAIGLTVVAFGTSMPELVVSVDAAITGSAAIAVGNVVGSNICNIALILGLSALLRPLAVNTRVVRVDIPLMVLTTLVTVVMLVDEGIDRLEGLLLMGGLMIYTGACLRAARRAPQLQAKLEALPPPLGTVRSVAYALGGLMLLVGGARLLVSGAVSLAEAAGVSEAVIGLTIVAVGTSLPELATSLLAAVRREGDIAIGNIVGSNIFNMLGILGTASLVQPLVQSGMSGLDLGVMITLAIVLLPLARSGWRVGRGEGALLFGSYVGYLALLAA